MIDASELADMQASVLASLDLTLDVLRSSDVREAGGGRAGNDWATVASGIPCRVLTAQRNTAEQVAQGRLTNTTYFQITVPVGTDVSERDRLAVSNGVTYEVANVLGPASVAVALRLLCMVVA